MTDALLDFLSKGWVGSLVGILGLVAGYFFYRRSLREPRLVYQLNAIRLIGKDELLPEDIDILYKGKNVSRLTKTQIVIWNSGKSTIEGEKIVHEDQLRLEFEDGEVLTKNIIHATRDVINFKLVTKKDEPHKVLFTFDFLDESDGVFIEILHSSSNRFPNVKGTIRGLPQGISSLGKVSLPTNKYKYKKTSILICLLGIAIILANIFVPSKYLFFSDEVNRVICLFLGVLYALFPLAIGWIGRRKFPKSLLSEEFTD